MQKNQKGTWPWVDKAAESLAVSHLAISGHVAFQAGQSAVGPSVPFLPRNHQQRHVYILSSAER